MNVSCSDSVYGVFCAPLEVVAPLELVASSEMTVAFTKILPVP